MATAIEIINTIRDQLGLDYAARVPAATRNNLGQVGDAITATKNIMNEFMGALWNQVGYLDIISRQYTSPLAILKGADVPMGSIAEETFINPATDIGYQTDGTFLLKNTTPDGKACYYGLNRESTYPQTISPARLKRAFTSEQSFMEFYQSIITSLYSGDQIDEFYLCKNVIGKALDAGAIQVVAADLTTANGARELAKSMANMSDFFTFPNTKFCGYNHVNASKITGGEKACTVFCPKENQVLLVRADVKNEINFEALASYFNLELVQIQAMTIIVDDIPSTNTDVYAVLCDRAAIQIRDSIFQVESEYIKSNMHTNVWLHHFQFIYVSMFANMIAFGKAKN